MIQEIKMPAAGQTTNKAVVYQICVKVGDTVKRGDALVEVKFDSGETKRMMLRVAAQHMTKDE